MKPAVLVLALALILGLVVFVREELRLVLLHSYWTHEVGDACVNFPLPFLALLAVFELVVVNKPVRPVLDPLGVVYDRICDVETLLALHLKAVVVNHRLLVKLQMDHSHPRRRISRVLILHFRGSAFLLVFSFELERMRRLALEVLAGHIPFRELHISMMVNDVLRVVFHQDPATVAVEPALDHTRRLQRRRVDSLHAALASIVVDDQLQVVVLSPVLSRLDWMPDQHGAAALHHTHHASREIGWTECLVRLPNTGARSFKATLRNRVHNS